MLVSIIIPTKNEAETIANIINGIREVFDQLPYKLHEIYIVDDSRDETRKVAEKLGAIVIIGGGRGLGYAMFKALKVVSRSTCDVILSIDGDGQADLKEIPKFLSTLEKSNSDLVLGSRFLSKGSVKYKYRMRNRFGTIALSYILRMITKLPLTDSHGGLRAMRREVPEELEMIGTHSYVQETIIDAVEKGFKVTEIPSVWHVRQFGSSKVVASIFSSLEKSNSDLVLGSRFLSKGSVKYKYRMRNRFGTIALSYILRMITKLPLTDSHGGLRAMRREVPEELEMIGTHSYVQETIIDAVEKGFKVTEIPSVWHVRQFGSSKVVASIFSYICYILPVLIVRGRYHLKGFFIAGLITLGLAFCDLGYVFFDTNFNFQAMLDRQSFHLFFLLLIFGFNLFFFGLATELLSLALKGINKNEFR